MYLILDFLTYLKIAKFLIMNVILNADNSQESQDNDSQDRGVGSSNGHIGSASSSAGYYDAEKCRTHIANQIKVSKIDRFSAQVSKAIEVESNIQMRLGNLMDMYLRHSAQATHDFTLRCKLGLQRHRQDRILNHQRKPSKSISSSIGQIEGKQYAISNDLLYGHGAQLIHALLTQSLQFTKHIKRKSDHDEAEAKNSGGSLSEDDYTLSDLFEPALYVKKLENCLRSNLRKSKAIMKQLNTVRRLFEKLGSEHRDRVDIVYAIEEERLATTVIRRSAYNLSMAAIKATSIPVHVCTNNEIS